MNNRVPPGNVVWRGCALIIALAMTALAGEKTPTLASSNATYPNLYYKILNLGSFQDEPTCPEHCSSFANDVNIWGQVVGKSHAGWKEHYAFRTGPNQAIAPTDILLQLSGYTRAEALGLNDDGVAVGHSVGYVSKEAVMWPAGGSQPYDLDSHDYPQSRAYAVTYNGMPVGGLQNDYWSGSEYKAWMINAWTVLEGFNGEAYDVNRHGVIVGYAYHEIQDPRRAFRWSSATGFEDLGTLDPSCPTCDSYAHAINDSGRIVGKSRAGTVGYVNHAFLWRRLFVIGASPMVDLGTLCRSDDYLCNSEARDINIHNHIVGMSDTTPSGGGDPRPFLYQGSGMVDINTLLSPVARAQWWLWDVQAINDLGQIVGTGYFQGQIRGYLLTPPINYIVSLLSDLPVLHSPYLVAERQSLGAKMTAAEAAVERGDLREAHRQLDAYQGEVQALVTTRRLNQIDATKLVAGVALIRREMGGAVPGR